MQTLSHGEDIAIDPQYCTGVPARQEVTFADGSALWLHSVHNGAGAAAVFERRIPTDDGEWQRVDLRRLAPDLAFRLPGTSTRDMSSAVFQSLRKRFGSTEQMRAAIGGLAQ